MPFPTSGAAGGHLVLQSNDVMAATEIIPFRPEIQSALEEIEKQGWKYIFIESKATAVAELDLEWSAYSIKPADPNDPEPESKSGPENLLELNIGTLPPKITAIPKVEAFTVSISSRSIPRAVTVDLVTGIVTQFSDQFWKWESGWEKDERRLSEAHEVYEIASWLVDVKKYRLAENLGHERYDELSKIFRAPMGSDSSSENRAN